MLPLDPKVQGLVKKVATPLEAVEKVRNVVLRRGGKKKKKRVPGASRGVVAREEQFSSGHWELWDPPLTPGPRGRLGLPGQRQPGGQRLHRAHLASRDTG